MSIRKLKPVTPSRRHMSISSFEEIDLDSFFGNGSLEHAGIIISEKEFH